MKALNSFEAFEIPWMKTEYLKIINKLEKEYRSVQRYKSEFNKLCGLPKDSNHENIIFINH